MKKIIMWLIPLLMIGGVFAMGNPDDVENPLGQMPYDSAIKHKPTLTSEKVRTISSGSNTVKTCKLEKEDCITKLKFMRQVKIYANENKYYLKYLGNNKFKLTDSNFNLFDKEKYLYFKINQAGKIVTNSGDTIYYEDLTETKDKSYNKYGRKVLMLSLEVTNEN